MKVWAYIDPELNVLCCALSKESVPDDVEAIEFKVDNIDDVVYVDGIIRLKTDEEKREEIRKRKIEEIQQEVNMYLERIESTVLSEYAGRTIRDRKKYLALVERIVGTRIYLREKLPKLSLEELKNFRVRNYISSVFIDVISFKSMQKVLEY